MSKEMYKVVYCEAETGVILNRDGSRWRKNSASGQFNPTFDSLEDARQLKDQLLAENPGGEVSIFDDGHRETHQDERLDQFICERNAFYQWAGLPWWLKIFRRKPECSVFQPVDAPT